MIPNVDPSYWLGGAEHGTEETRARATEKYGLDDPLPVQYVRLMEAILSGEVESSTAARACGAPSSMGYRSPSGLSRARR
jgi:ABC-type dipeptide/oligopeptide/nickel transport system permease component